MSVDGGWGAQHGLSPEERSGGIRWKKARRAMHEAGHVQWVWCVWWEAEYGSCIAEGCQCQCHRHANRANSLVSTDQF